MKLKMRLSLYRNSSFSIRIHENRFSGHKVTFNCLKDALTSSHMMISSENMIFINFISFNWKVRKY